jgi:hypothetical protein
LSSSFDILTSCPPMDASPSDQPGNLHPRYLWAGHWCGS